MTARDTEVIKEMSTLARPQAEETWSEKHAEKILTNMSIIRHYTHLYI